MSQKEFVSQQYQAQLAGIVILLLHKVHKPKNVDEQKQSLQSVRHCIPATMLHHLLGAIKDKMRVGSECADDHLGQCLSSTAYCPASLHT